MATQKTADRVTYRRITRDNRAYLARSIAECETQLCENAFSEPLDAAQIKRLSNIEGIIAQYRQLEHQDDNDSDGIAAEFRDRVGDIEHRVQPWVKKKDVLVASLQGDSDDDGDGDSETNDGISAAFVSGTERDALQVVPDVFGNGMDGDNTEHWTDRVSPKDLLPEPPNDETKSNSVGNNGDSPSQRQKEATASKQLSGTLAEKRKGKSAIVIDLCAYI
ncbi:hypothetical protein EV175_002220, partial [Coemansia sp. RSA 1933]